MKRIDAALYEGLRAEAQRAPRRRVHHCLHESQDDPVQRLVVDMEPGTYIRPHRHGQSPKWELFFCLVGRAAVLLFDDAGLLTEKLALAATGPCYGVEIPAGIWHTLIIEERGTLLVEIKPGPYAVLPEEDFAPWAPAEGEPGAAGFEAALQVLPVGKAVLSNIGRNQ
ncbi:WbuC family cupin fold metalloprotein [Thiovibrio frasassiensis]|jgi:cupin fold WbuC family metalloprotein|uniref:WbuC family cupin fold metalloprotein n=1 Tax=Thiovibrio frasassiensis TaxID=2984131 RepID=A0A9X4MF38_9BACT|nr:WbuC family cupin fold metalloprotein [Thiovibrio frasassiensis]MDG4474990.1 WbuC family cupin fold metalloprotein [Thiovibrio frasassiensis]